MKRTLLKFGMIVATLLSFLPASAYDFEVDGIYYNILSTEDLTCEVTQSPNKYLGELVIPKEVSYNNQQLNVVSIGQSAFSGCSSLTSITLPDNLTTIGSSAFKGCTSLNSIKLPEKLTTIGSSGFSGCSSLTEIVLPDNLTTIESDTFFNCSALAKIVLPEKLVSIGSGVFAFCESLIAITLPDDLTTIQSNTFSQCTSLKTIVLPKELTTIGDFAFLCCHSLTEIALPDNLTTIGGGAFEGVAFKEIILPENLTTIGGAAFLGCNNLTEITLPKKLTSIGGNAFRYSKLTSIKIPNSVTSIGWECFADCQKLENIKLSHGLKRLEFGTFCSCESLKSLTIPGSIEYLVLYGDTSLGLFYDCNELKELTLEYGSVRLSAQHCYYVNSEYTYYPADLMFASAQFKNHMDTPLPIETATIDRELSNNISLNYLKYYTIGEHVKYNQVNLYRSKNLETITCLAINPPTGMENLSNDQYINVVVKVPKESLEAYKNADGWRNFWNIEGIDTSGLNDVAIGTSEGMTVVYNLQGLMVLKTENREDISQLPSGVYIVNGKKIFVR